jgi:hypothetical protein
MVIGAESGAATGPIPAEARPQGGLRLERPGASLGEIRLVTSMPVRSMVVDVPLIASSGRIHR